MKFYCINDTFVHCHGSCDKVRPKSPWIFNEIPAVEDMNPVLYVDHKIMEAKDLPESHDFGWLCESPPILDSTVNWILDNMDWCENRFIGIFTPDKSLLEVSDLFIEAPGGSNMPWIKDWKMRPKSKLVSIIASDKRHLEGHRLRHKIVEKDPTIDVYGRGYSPIDSKEEGLEDYMFSFCIENAQVDFYYTEKITDAIACGTIPIYWGSEDIFEVFDPRGILMLEDLTEGVVQLSPELYEEMIPFAENNLRYLQEIRTADDVVQDLMKDMMDE